MEQDLYAMRTSVAFLCRWVMIVSVMLVVSGKSFNAVINPESNGNGEVTVYKKYLNLLDKEEQNVHISDSKIVFESTESTTLLTVSTCQTA